MPWQTDPAHSDIQFTARHMMLSKVRGEFQQYSIEVDLDEDNPADASVVVEIDAASISTRDEQRDGHLKSPDFLNVEKYPTITFRSTEVERTGESSALLRGDLTIVGVSRPVELQVEFLGKAQSPWGATSIGFEAHTKISRKEWGLTWNAALETGGFLVGDTIAIDVEAELVYQE